MSAKQPKEILRFLNTDSAGNIFNENSMGAKVEPCGTPYVKGAEEEYSPMWTEKVFSVSYDFKTLQNCTFDAKTLFKS